MINLNNVKSMVHNDKQVKSISHNGSVIGQEIHNPVQINFNYAYKLRMYDDVQNNYYATSSQLETLSSGTTNSDDGLIVVFLTASEINAINNKTYTATTSIGVDLLTARQTATGNRYYICYVQGQKVYIVGRTDYNTGWYNLIGTTDDSTLGRHVYISRSGTSNLYYITVDQSSSGQTSAWRIVHNADHEVQGQATADSNKVLWFFDTVSGYSMEI